MGNWVFFCFVDDDDDVDGDDRNVNDDDDDDDDRNVSLLQSRTRNPCWQLVLNLEKRIFSTRFFL